MVATQRFWVNWNESENSPRIRTIDVTTETVFLVLFIGGLAWVPFWLGSNRLIIWAINAIVFPGLAALYELSLMVRGAPDPVVIRRIRISAILFAIAASWALLQNATWMPAGWQHPIWQLAAELLGRQIPGSISVDRDLTALALIRLMTAASVFWLALRLGDDDRRARLLLWSVVAIGGLYAAIGLFAPGLNPEGALFEEIGRSRHFVSSTFVNQNHYATFAGIGFIAVLALTLRLYRRELRQSGDLLQLKIAALIKTTGTKGALPFALAFLILTALLLSGSRGGIISTGGGIFVLLVLSLLRLRRRLGRNEAVFILFAAVAVSAALFGFGDVFAGRVETQGLQSQDRLMVSLTTIWSILSAPFLGNGYGTFASAFPMFRDNSLGVWLFWDKVHNTYLEIFQGLGLIFGTMLIVSVLLLVFHCLKGSMVRHRDATVPAVAASVSFLVGAHALVDFSLEIQAVTLTYMAVLGAGVAQATKS